MVLGLNRVRYFIVHLPSIVMSQMKDLRARLTLQNVQYVPEVVLLVALGLGLYTQWSLTQDPVISFIAITALFVFAVSCALRYYCNLQKAGSTVFHLWVGCLIGILAYSDSSAVEYVTTQEAMEARSDQSGFRCVLAHLTRLLNWLTPTQGFWNVSRAGRSGFAHWWVLVTGRAAWVLALMTLAFMMHIAALRLKSTPTILSLAAFIIISIISIFPALSLHPNVYALVCFTGRHALPAILDLYLSGHSMLNDGTGWCSRCPASCVTCHGGDSGTECSSGSDGWTEHHSAQGMVCRLPLFLAVSAVWLLLHLAYFAACWQLMGKVLFFDCFTFSYEKTII